MAASEACTDCCSAAKVYATMPAPPRWCADACTDASTDACTDACTEASTEAYVVEACGA